MWNRLMRPLAVGLTLLLVPLAVSAQELDEARIKELALEAILESPEILLQAMDILEAQEAEAQASAARAVLEQERDTLEQDPNAPVMGNPDGDVTVVEFMDYNCPYCRQAHPEVARLLEEDSNVRVVLREWPILSEGSVFAARAALAARKQDLYAEMHEALMSLQQPADEISVLRVAGELGLDLEQLQRDMDDPAIDEHIATSNRLVSALGFSGTPSFVIGDTLLPGFVSYDELATRVEDARAAE